MKAANFVTVVRSRGRITIPHKNVEEICRVLGITTMDDTAVVFEIKKIILSNGKTIDLNNV
ncbi:MAG: hypothetical protein ACRENZ_01160 [Thermodesulfobacteriota bacterium]